MIDANGQSCDRPSVAIVRDDVHDRFVEVITSRVEKFSIGPGVDDPDLDALISERQLHRVESYIASALDEGARIAVGESGRRVKLSAGGWFIEATILTGVSPGMRVAREEIFGPVLA